jgi:sarcosine oxidase subunit alpha
MNTELLRDIANKPIDLLIIGAGPAGLAAGFEAASSGARVLIVDEAPEPGGRLPAQKHKKPHGYSDGAAEALELITRAESAGAKFQTGVTAWGLSWDKEHGWFAGICPVDRVTGSCPAGIKARSVILALGAVQRPLVMPGWTMPGVITAGAAQTMVGLYNALPGERVLCVGLDPLCLAAAEAMAGAGAKVLGPVLPPDNGLQFGPVTPRAAIQELARLADWAPSALLSAMARMGAKMPELAARLYPSSGLGIGGFKPQLKKAALELMGNGRVRAARLAHLDSQGSAMPGDDIQYEVDAVVTSAGLRPLTDLAQVGGCRLVHIPQLGGWTVLHGPDQQTPREGLFVAGSSGGVEGAAVAQAQGRLAGMAAAHYLSLMDENTWMTAADQARQEIDSARKDSLPFSEDINAGRSRMADLWASQG